MSRYRLCKECGELKPAEQFLPRDSTRPYTCKPCWSWQMKRYRDRSPELKRRNQASSRTYNGALRELKARHPEEFTEIHTQQKAKEGLT